MLGELEGLVILAFLLKDFLDWAKFYSIVIRENDSITDSIVTT